MSPSQPDFRAQPPSRDIMSLRRRAQRFLTSVLDPRPFLFLLRLVHFYNYEHVAPRREMSVGREVGLPPTVSLRHGRRIHIGDGTRIGGYCALWAGEQATISIGAQTTFGPRVFVTVSNYGLESGTAPMQQERHEESVVIGDGVWLGTGVTVLPGVSIGDGCVVGANTVVSESLPPNSIAVGAKARVVRSR